MASNIQTRASAPDGQEYELFVYFIYDENQFSITGGRIDKGVFVSGETWPTNAIPTTDKGDSVKWFFDKEGKHPVESSDFTKFVLNEEQGSSYIFGAINLYGIMKTTPLKFKLGAYDKDFFLRADGHVSEEGTLYFATSPNLSGKMYLYYGDGTNYINIVPEMLTQANGGTGINLSLLDPYSVIVQNGQSSALEGIAPTKGVLQVLEDETKPIYAIVPAKLGGTGQNTLTKGALLVGNDTDPVTLLEKGTKGWLVGSTGSTPAYFNTPISWAYNEDSSALTLTLNIVNSSNTVVLSHTAQIPAASINTAGIVTNTLQTFSGHKTFNNDVTIGLNALLTVDKKLVTSNGEDAYYNSSSDHKEGDIETEGGISIGKNLRVDGGNIQFSKEAKITYDADRDCFNFVFV